MEERELAGDVDGDKGKTVISGGKEDELLVVEGFRGGAGAGEAELAANLESVEAEEVERETGAFWLEAGKRMEETRGARAWVVGDFDEPGAVVGSGGGWVDEEEGAVGEGEGGGESDGVIEWKRGRRRRRRRRRAPRRTNGSETEKVERVLKALGN